MSIWVKKKKIINFLFLFFTVFLLIYTLSIGIRNYFRYNAYVKELSLDLDMLNLLRQKNLFYKRELIKMESDDYWELQVKKQFPYLSQGEVLIKFIEG